MSTAIVSERKLRRGRARVTVEVDPEVLAIIEAKAEEAERDLSKQIRWIFSRYVKAVEKGKM